MSIYDDWNRMAKENRAMYPPGIYPWRCNRQISERHRNLSELMRIPNTTVLLGNHEIKMREVVKDEFQWNQVRKWYINGGI